MSRKIGTMVLGLLLLSSSWAWAKKTEALPALVGITSGTQLQVSGLATGTMAFETLTPQKMVLYQDMELNWVAQTAMKAWAGERVAIQDGWIQLAYTVYVKQNGELGNFLVDRNTGQTLVTGPAQVISRRPSAQRQQIELRSYRFRMTVDWTQKSTALMGSARFQVGDWQIPGQIDFQGITGG